MDKTILKTQIDGYMNYCKNVRQMTEQSIKSKSIALNRFLKEINCDSLQNLTNNIFNDWIEFQFKKNIKSNSVKDYTQKVVAMIRWNIEMGVNTPLKIPLIPTFRNQPTRRNYYSKETIDNVLKNADEVSGLMIRICFDTGMRIRELTNLKISDFSGKKVTFIGKGRIFHESYIRDETRKLLTEYLNKYDVKKYLWEEPRKEKPISVQSVSKRMKAEFKKNGIDDFHPHALRHSFATNLQKQGASVEEIQHMIGHSNASITERYLHGFEGDKMEKLFEKYA